MVNVSLLGGEAYCESTKRQLSWQGRDLLAGDEWRGMGPYGRMRLIVNNNAGERPIYFSRYAARERGGAFSGRLQLCGMAYRLCDTVSADSVDCERSYRLMTERLDWHPVTGVYIDETSHNFLMQYWDAAVLVVSNLASRGEQGRGGEVLDSTCAAIPPQVMKSPQLLYNVAKAYRLCGNEAKSLALLLEARQSLAQHLEYYGSMRPEMLRYIPYTLSPLLTLRDSIYACTTGASPLTR